MRFIAKLLLAWFVAVAVAAAPLAVIAAPLGVDVAVLNGPPCAFPGSALDLNFQLNAATLNCHQAGLATGQLTITRTTPGYVQYNNNCLVSVPSGAFRVSDKGLLVEEARTNDDLWSRDMTNAAWVKVNATTSQTATGADCLANTATQITATAGNATVLQTITLGSTADTYDVWLQRVSGTGNIQITADGSTWTTKTLTTAWQMFQVTQTLANPVSGIRIVTSGDVINADFNQLEPGGFATSPILTTTVPVTRNADAITLPTVATTAITGTQGYMYTMFTAPSLPSVAGRFFDNNNGVVRTAIDSSGNLTITRNSGGSQATAAPLYSASSTARFSTSWGAAGLMAVINGGSVASATDTLGATTSPTYIGNNSALTRALNGYFMRFVIGATQPSAAQLAAFR